MQNELAFRDREKLFIIKHFDAHEQIPKAHEQSDSLRFWLGAKLQNELAC